MRRGSFLLLVLLLVSSATAADRQIRVAPSAPRVERCAKIEFTLAIDAVGDNPFDPGEIDLHLDLTSPSGKTVCVPAFYAQPFEYRRLGRAGPGSEWLYPAGQPVWKVRFAPTEPGRYKGRAVLKDRAGTASSDDISFECVPSSSKGFIRVSTKDPRYLEHDDGTPFFAVGQDIAFVTDSDATIEKIRRLGENGANFARVWACAEDSALAIEARKSAWGRSWAWNPPIVAEPDRDGYHSAALCLKLSGPKGASLRAEPTRPLALRPDTKYRLTGRIKTDKGARLELDLNGTHPLAGKWQWARFEQEFTTGPDQWSLPALTFRLTTDGAAWLSDLSLKEAGGGPELLEEAEVNRPIVGVYNQPDCFLLDRIVAAAEEHGVYLQIVFLTRDHYMRLLARENSRDYDRAVSLAAHLARYCAARWGYSTHVAVWEYFNEIDPGLPTGRFYDEVGQTFERTDVNHHLRATSAWSAPAKHYRHPRLDTADHHFYLRPPLGERWKDEVAMVLAQWQLLQEHVSGKPIIFSEFGITDSNWQHAPELDQDRSYVHLHNALWTSALAGFASTVCDWYWDDIQRRDLYALYRPVSRFVADIPWTTGHLRPISASCDDRLRIVGLKGDHGAYFWVADRSATWWKLAIEHVQPETIRNAAVHVEGLEPGAYRVQWWDTVEGKIRAEESVSVPEHTLDLHAPAFKCDLACKILGNGSGAPLPRSK